MLDFGIAKALSLSRKVTRNDFGSMPYLSPERLDSTEVDAHADLWALGVILYELLSGTPPFQAVDTRRLEQQIRAGYAQPAASGELSRGPCRRSSRGCSRRTWRTAIASAARRARRSGAVPRGQAARLRQTQGFRPRRWTKRPAHGAAPVTTIRSGRGGRSSRRPRQPLRSAGAASSAGAGASRSPSAAPAAIATEVGPIAPDSSAAAARRAVPRLQRNVVGFRAGRVAARAATRDLDSMDDVWGQYDALSHRSYLRLGVGAPRTDDGRSRPPRWPSR